MKFVMIFVTLVCSFQAIYAKDKPDDLLKLFPKKVGGFQAGEMHKYDDDRLGSSMAYNGDGGTVTMYLYDMGNNKIETGVDDKLVKQEFANASEHLKMMEQRGGYKNVKKIKEETKKIKYGKNGKKTFEFLYSQHKFDIVLDNGTASLTSDTYVAGFKNHVFKIRISSSKYDKDKFAEKVTRLITEVLTKVAAK